MIDWQHCSVLPLSLQAGVPKYFRNYGNEESERLTTLRLSDNLAELIEEEKVTAMEQWSKHHIQFYYLAALANLNKVHFRACMEDWSIFRSRIFQHAGKPWEGDSMTLKVDLIQVMQDWKKLVEPVREELLPYPISYTEKAVEDCLRISARQRDADVWLRSIRDSLGITADGLTLTNNYDDTIQQTKLIKKKVLEDANDAERVHVQKHWPFDDFDERE